MLSLLRALQQADTAFPSGSFAFSHGVEGLADLGVRFDLQSMAGVFEAVLRHRWAGCDRVALVQGWRCGADPAGLMQADTAGPMEIDTARFTQVDTARLMQIDQAVEAATLPATLRRGSRSNGAALLSAHVRIGTPSAAALHTALASGALLGHLAPLQGALWRALGIGERQAVLVSGYTTVTALASAAVRLGCFGALAAQEAIGRVLSLIEALASDPVAMDAPLSGTLPWLDVACAQHGSSSVRLFSS